LNVDSWLGHDRQLVSTTKKRSGMFNAALTLRREAFTLGGVMDQASVFFLGGGAQKRLKFTQGNLRTGLHIC